MSQIKTLLCGSLFPPLYALKGNYASLTEICIRENYWIITTRVFWGSKNMFMQVLGHFSRSTTRSLFERAHTLRFTNHQHAHYGNTGFFSSSWYELAPGFIHFSSFVLCITIYSVIFYNTGTSTANEMWWVSLSLTFDPHTKVNFSWVVIASHDNISAENIAFIVVTAMLFSCK